MHAVHRTIVVVDVEGFGDPRRTLPHQVGLRAGLYRVVAAALAAAGVSWEACHHEDRGDSVFVLVPPEFVKAPLVEVLPGALAAALRVHNDCSAVAQRVRLRVVVHAGEVVFDGHGVTSAAVTTAFRLLDAPSVKTALADSSGLVALVVSRWIFDEVVRHSEVLDPATFRPVAVAVKEVRETAWIALPDHPYPAEPAVLDRPGAALDGSGAVAPRQLPAPPAHFVGREEHLADLDRALSTAEGSRTGPAVFLSAIGGAGGIGKTWLALAWAHRNLDRFPDGQLFVDLRGFSPAGDPVEPAVAVRGFLDALGVAPARIPTDPDAQAALYRSLVAGRRLLVVLDNAATAHQVIPLLPGSPTCTVLVTCRRRPASLIDRHGARHLTLDVLSHDEARALLAHRLGPDRATADLDAVDELIGLCGGHPLALAITARAAEAHPAVPLAEVAAELRELGLEMLDHDTDPAASLPTVLSWSLRRLTDHQRTLFALLGIAPGPDTTPPATAALAGLSPTAARKALTALEDASLLERRPGGRYAMHDLVRAYAATTARALPDDVGTTALVRVTDFHLHTAHAAERLLEPHRTFLSPDPPAPGVRPLALPDVETATTWLEAEHATLLATQRTAAALGHHHAVWHLAWNLHTFHSRHGHHRDDLVVWRMALDASAHLPDPATRTRTRTHRALGRACSLLGRHEEAIGHLDQALDLATRHHDPTEQSHTHRQLAASWELVGDDRRALDHARRSLDLYRALDRPVWEAYAHNQVGWYAARLGEFDTARDHCHAALALQRHHHDTSGEANTLDSLGYIAHRTGEHHQALHHYHQALALYRTLDHPYRVAGTLDHIGHPHVGLGQHDHARAAWNEALELYREQGRDADVRRIEQQLDGLDAPCAPARHWK